MFTPSRLFTSVWTQSRRAPCRVFGESVSGPEEMGGWDTRGHHGTSAKPLGTEATFIFLLGRPGHRRKFSLCLSVLASPNGHRAFRAGRRAGRGQGNWPHDAERALPRGCRWCWEARAVTRTHPRPGRRRSALPLWAASVRMAEEANGHGVHPRVRRTCDR